MATVTQFCVGLDNKAGTLAGLCGVLRKAKVNIDAISVIDNAECNWVRLVASPTAKAKAALSKAGYHFCTQRVLRVAVDNAPGALEALATRLGKAGVNMNYLYGSQPQGAKGAATLIISAGDLQRAAKLLKA